MGCLQQVAQRPCEVQVLILLLQRGTEAKFKLPVPESEASPAHTSETLYLSVSSPQPPGVTGAGSVLGEPGAEFAAGRALVFPCAHCLLGALQHTGSHRDEAVG